MAGETKPAPFFKTDQKKDCFNRREASVIDSYFIHTFYPTPSIFRVKRWQSPVNSPPPQAPTHPAPLYPNHQGPPTTPTLGQQPYGTTSSIWWACKAQVCLGIGFHHVTLTGLPVRLAWVVRAFANHLLKWPLSHSWLTTFHEEGDRKTSGNRNKSTRQTNIQNVKYFIFLKCCCPHYLQTKVL